MYQGHRAHIEILDYGDGWAAADRVCFSNRDTPPPSKPPGFLSAIATDNTVDSVQDLARRLGDEWQAAIHRWRGNTANDSDSRLLNWAIANRWIGTEASVSAQRERLSAENRITELVRNLPQPMRVTAAVEGTGGNERVYIRGNPRMLGEEAPRQLLTALVGPQPRVESGSGRLALARQVADPANPLTARVLVNRVWHHLFGTGIVPTTDNLGVLGERPTHPELLDHLAQQLVMDGWSIKRLIRSMVLSSTYQMSSDPSAGPDELDPTNRLWHRTNIRRLEGEAIRDAMLVASGRLDQQLFGPSVAIHITPFMQGRGKPTTSGPIDGEGRRSVYLEVRRNFLSPMMLAFDTPIPFNTVGRRNNSTVPAQALILMNDPFVIEQSQQFGKRLLSEKDFEERIDRAYTVALSRLPTSAERLAVREFFDSQSREHGIRSDQATSDVRVWSDFCHVLFNVKEFVFVH
jgi:hypothetical protein